MQNENKPNKESQPDSNTKHAESHLTKVGSGAEDRVYPGPISSDPVIFWITVWLHACGAVSSLTIRFSRPPLVPLPLSWRF